MSKFEDVVSREWRHNNITDCEELLVRFVASTRMRLSSESATPELSRLTEDTAVTSLEEFVRDILGTPDIVHCRECKLASETVDQEIYCKRSFRTGHPDGYCAWAVRK